MSSLEAYNASKSYIIPHLTGPWSKYREGVNYQVEVTRFLGLLIYLS